jgi:rhodanese-related sulfurtransferase
MAKVSFGRCRGHVSRATPITLSAVSELPDHVPPERVAELAEAGEAELIDVRRDYEFAAGHLAGARHVEVNDLTAKAGSISKGRPVIFYCRGGSRSGMAAEAFRQAGYDAHNMEGGLSAWDERGLPLEPEGGEVTEVRPV